MNAFLEFVSPHKYAPRTHQKFANIKMDYMYRDAGNNKLRAFQVFSDNYFLSICQIGSFMSAAFIDEKWFDPDLCGIERLSFDRYHSDIDHEWHEIEEIRLTNDPATINIDITDFLLNAIKVHARSVEHNCEEEKIEFNL